MTLSQYTMVCSMCTEQYVKQDATHKQAWPSHLKANLSLITMSLLL